MRGCHRSSERGSLAGSHRILRRTRWVQCLRGLQRRRDRERWRGAKKHLSKSLFGLHLGSADRGSRRDLN